MSTPRIAVVGLGYVGLPLAVAFSHQFEVIGYDIDLTRIEELKSNNDRTQEISVDELMACDQLRFTAEKSDILDASVFIVTAPTPIDKNKKPDLRPLLSATRAVGESLSHGDTVIFESTVYPGLTEEECVPVLERCSGLNFNEGFTVGYSPERINPGDKEHRFTSILKLTSGSTPKTAQFVENLYGQVVDAGTYMAPSIKVAEAAKVIENTQRDINIALVNEIALICDRLGIATHDVLAAAGTKWNFLPFKPGLVGGHCISVDPYYLTHKAQELGYHPEVILAGRRVNDSMGAHVGHKLVQRMVLEGTDIRNATVLVLGCTFKEDTPDLRNSRVVDVITCLRDYGIDPDVHDPWVSDAEIASTLGAHSISVPQADHYDAVLVAVPHKQFVELGVRGLRNFLKGGAGILYDLKSVFPADHVDLTL